ncbi:DUF3074 family protein, implicated in vesicle trafficking or lipid metabolism [Schizosaccharomyces osmophilus]|uniref:DUF3074 family protein, implicated in vesicle trafficking or lipid metabolism n=1 Tax=Schizosaccharomyces osmophilus TaxID=2545709 RepID=A0AAF0AV18_9SCHI|nr:DUF3074 family protein, implicated in vesicle trafficking or lipid metabolism [Schizosaccharomyces osmophilus]WBW71480.1 DUF3074 family protein, implicated in vesicle trafficking or lipid metabolism [Schizosaccharomyces osmophilus]
MQEDFFGSEVIQPLISNDVLKATDPNFERWREKLIQDALRLVEEIPRWKSLGSHDGVALYEKAPPNGGNTWYGRVSRHKRSLKTFKKGLLYEHIKKEECYDPLVFSASQLETIIEDEIEVWMYRFKTPWFCRNRIYKQLVISVMLDPDSFIVLQRPVQYINPNPAFISNSQAVPGYYESVDFVSKKYREDGKDDGVLWICAVRNDYGKMLSSWFLGPTFTKLLTRQVKLFNDWLNKTYPKKG